MILHPGILALLTGSVLALLMVGYASGLGLKILARWDFYSSSAEQLKLERQTYLISTVVNYALGFEIISGLLFIYTLEDIHRLFVGAMCATGSLNANPIGWYLLLVKIVIFFVAAIWVALNHLDQRSENFPLVRLKYKTLLLIGPLLFLSLILQLSYFLGLQPEIITSCCGSLFSLGSDSVASELSGLAPVPTMVMFYVLSVLVLVVQVAALFWRHKLLRYMGLLLNVGLFLFSLVSILSFISLYIYEMPTHHCPFDMIQGNYHYIGYPLYISLFSASVFGMLPGIMQPFSTVVSLQALLKKSEKRWLLLSLCSWMVFLGLVSWPIVFGHFSLVGY